MAIEQVLRHVFDERLVSTPEILVDDHDVQEAELAGVLGQPVLAALTFLVVEDLAL